MLCKILMAATGLMLAVSTAGAQPMPDMPHACAAPNAPPPPALSGWARKDTLASATRASALKDAALPLERGITVSLYPTRQVRCLSQPEKPGRSGAYGGMVTLAIPAAGRYQVSLSSGAWIDLLKDGATQRSVAHAPGPQCTPVRKTVIFALQPGSYVLQVSANADPAITVMVTHVS